jgi:hypothetical protein
MMDGRTQPTALDVAVVQWLWKQDELIFFNIAQLEKLLTDRVQRKFWIPLIAKNKNALQILVVCCLIRTTRTFIDLSESNLMPMSSIF